MAEFINTIDVLGDDAVIDSIIDRTITEFKDNKLTSIGNSAFYGCKALTAIDLPAVKTLADNAFRDCTALESIDFASITTNGGHAFRDCKNLKRVYMPMVGDPGYWSFNACSSLESASFPSATHAHQYCLASCTKLHYLEFSNLTVIRMGAFANALLTAFVLRREGAICNLDNVNAFQNTSIANGTGYIYVPRSLLDSYKAATNWSTFATQFRALEDYTIDGTVTGKFNGGVVTTDLYGVSLNNEDTFVMGSYQATLTPFTGHDITEVSVTMDGEDITNSVYSNGVIDIPLVAGDITIAARTDIRPVMVLLPLDTTKRLPRYRLNVRAGQTLRLHYYLTGPHGYLYDGRGCGSEYVRGGLETNTYKYRDITIAQDGFIVISDFWASNNEDGKLPPASTDVLVGNYLYVEILE